MTFICASCGFKVVDEGTVGIKKDLGKIIGDELPPGLYFYNPFTVSIIEMDVREQKWTNKTIAYTKDVQTASVDFEVNYRPDPTFMVELYKSFGNSYIEIIFPQVVLAKIKEVIGQFEASPLVAERRKASDAIKKLLVDELLDKKIIVTNFELTGIDYNDEFERAVEAKVTAKERALEEQNRTVQVKEKAEQQLFQARAEAESIRIKSEALSRNKDLIQFEAVQKWDGKLPQYMMGNSMPFINLKATNPQ
jgi:regulator of protease activity HflC (stomatin/prohibitin superfamily)